MTDLDSRLLHAELDGLFSNEWTVSEGAEVLARLKGSPWTFQAQADVGGRSFTYKANWTGSKIAVWDDLGERVVARAEKMDLFARRYRVLPLGRSEAAGGSPELIIVSGTLSRTFRLWLGDEEVGSIRYKGVLGRQVELRVPSNMPLELVVLGLYISRTVRRQTGGHG